MKLNTVDPRWFSFLASLRIMCLVVGSVLVDQHLGQTQAYHIVEAVGGSVMAVGSAVWGVYASFMGLWRAQAIGVQAGINMTAAGNAVDTRGDTITAQMPNGVPPKSVTLQSSRQIVKDYGPDVSHIGHD